MNKKHLTVVIAVVFTILASPTVLSGDAAAGKSKAAACAACHGQNGISANPEWPNLAGQQEAYLANQLKAFKSGERKNAIMAPQTAGLSDDDIKNLATYYSSLK